MNLATRVDPLSQKPSGDAAYDALIAAIRNGMFRPGDRLREEMVADQLGLSRTPVREALRRLEAERIVEHKPRTGAIVRTLGHSELVELYEMRVVLERTAAELAARHGTRAEFDALNDINQDIARERQSPSLAAAINQEFHRALYHACRNRFLVDAASGLNNALLLLGPTTFSDAERIDVVVGQHQAIIDALRAGDGSAAADAAEDHLQTSLRHRLRRLDP